MTKLLESSVFFGKVNQKPLFFKLGQFSVSFLSALALVVQSQVSPVYAATATAGGTHASPALCDQNVSDATNVEVVRLDSGDCVLTFKSGSVTWTAPQGLSSANIFLVGGGGGGGSTFDTRGAGGGGAGQVTSNSSFNITGNSVYTINVGAGGSGGVQPGATLLARRTNAPENVGSNGSDTYLSLDGTNLLIAYGGLGGCGSRTTVYESYCTTSTDNGTGGAAATASSGGGRGGAGGGGGGGSSGAGASNSGTRAGGSGTTSSITGSSITYGVGGNGGTTSSATDGTAGTANRGNGGSGASSNGASANNGGAGGSGVVLIRFSPDFVPGTPTLVTFVGGDKRVTITFTQNYSGSSSVSDYEYSLNGGSYISAGTTSSPFTITGLNGRTAYSVTLKARNSVGLSSASSSLSATTTDASLDAREAAAAEAARVAAAAAEAARAAAAKQQKELTEILSIIPELGKLSLNIGKTSQVLSGQKCVKGKKVKFVSKNAKCPKGYSKKK